MEYKEIMEEKLKNDTYFLSSYIPFASDIEKMGIKRAPVATFSKGSFSALTFFKLWEEILKYIE